MGIGPTLGYYGLTSSPSLRKENPDLNRVGHGSPLSNGSCFTEVANAFSPQALNPAYPVVLKASLAETNIAKLA